MIARITAIASVVIREMYRRKDFYVLFILTGLLTILLGSINFFNEARIINIIKEFSLGLIWISTVALAVFSAARQIPAERENRTVFPLLAKPVSRDEVVLGKGLGCWVACGVCLVVFYLFLGIVIAAKSHSLPLSTFVQACWMHWIFLGIVISMTLLGSIVFAAPSSNATIVLIATAGILAMGQHLNKVAMTLAQPLQGIVFAVYFAMPHLEFYYLRDAVVYGGMVVSWRAVVLATLYGAAYAGFFLALTCWIFRRKNL